MITTRQEWHNMVRGRGLYLSVFTACQQLPAPVTNIAIREHLVTQAPVPLNSVERRRLLRRIAFTTDLLVADGRLRRDHAKNEALKTTYYIFTHVRNE